MLTRPHFPSAYDAYILAESKINVCVELERGVGCIYFVILFNTSFYKPFSPQVAQSNVVIPLTSLQAPHLKQSSLLKVVCRHASGVCSTVQ